MSEHPPKKVVEDSKEAEKIDALMREAEAAEVKPPQIEPSQTAEEETEKEGTPKEWKDKLREAVGKLTDVAGEKFDNAKEKIGGWMSERGEKFSGYFAKRSTELDTEAAKLGWVERSFRKLGERYDKLGWKSKLGVGLGLGIGAGVSAAVSLPVAWMFLGGVAAQRVAGLSSMFITYEKTSESKEEAILKAVGKQVVMTGGMLLLVEGAKEAGEWLKDNWPFGNAEAAMMQQAHAPEMPQVSVEASGGHGYEYMAKRLWEQLQDKGLDPNNYAENSDIHKLLSADAASIDKVVHQIASDQQHGFYNADGTSVLISPDAHMTIGADGQIHLGGAVHAPEGIAVTPAYHPEVHAVSPPVETPTSTAPQQPPAPETQAASTTPAEAVRLSVPYSGEKTFHIIDDIESRIKEFVPTTEASPSAPIEALAPNIDHLGEVPSDSGPAVSPHETLPAYAAHENIVTTAFGLEVPINEPHLYAGWEDGQVFVYGGSSPVERAKMILEYLQEHPKEVVYSAADNGEHRIPWHLEDGRAVPDLPVHQNHFFGFFRSFMKAPEPTDLRELIPSPTHHAEMPVTPHVEVPTPSGGIVSEVNEAHDAIINRTFVGETTQPAEHATQVIPAAEAHATSEHGAVQQSDNIVQGHLEYGAENHHLAKNWLDEVREHTTDAKSRLVGERVVRIKAQELELYERQLKAMQERGNDGTATYEALKKKISLVIEQVERKYGNVFNDKIIK